MKKMINVKLLIGISTIIIIMSFLIVAACFKNNFLGNITKKSKDVSINSAISEKMDNSKKSDADDTGIKTIKEDEYTILLRGSARPNHGEISINKAVTIGIDNIEKTYNTTLKDPVINMYFLDGILSKMGNWSGHIKVNHKEKYEFLIDGEDGSILFTNSSFDKNNNQHPIVKS